MRYLWLLLLMAACTRPGPQAPVHLRTEGLDNPLGLATAAPRFSWWVQDSRRAAVQSAWQIQVDTLPGQGGLWDSGRQTGRDNIQVPYGGPPLRSGERYYWRVRTWDAAGQPSPWSAVHHWEMAFTRPEDWQAQWIGTGEPVPTRDEDFYTDQPAPLLRKAFTLPAGVQRARLYITGLGYYEAYLDGEKIGDRVLEPGWTNYGKRTLYSVYDVTDQLGAGPHVLGVLLGNGWYNPLPLRLFGRWNLREILTIGPPKVLAQLHLTLADGREQVIGTDTSWTWAPSHILRNNVYLGEKQDGARRRPDWTTPGAEPGPDWQPVVAVPAPGGELLPQLQPPIRITRALAPVAITQPAPGVHVVDFGQNFAGVVRMRVQGPAGTEVRLRYGELLFDDGRVNGLTTVACQIKEMWNLNGGPGAPPTAWQEDSYRLAGGGEEVFQPHFTFHGFRYVEVTGYPGTPTPADFTGLRMNADLEAVGAVRSSAAFDAIQEMVTWTLLSNVFSVESDCPGREKFGYGGDMISAGETYLFNYDMWQFYAKAVRDFRDDRRPNGGMPECAPHIGIDTKGFGEETGPIGWQLAYPFLQQKLYQFYGDRRIIEEEYPYTRDLVAFLRGQAVGHRITHGISDHESLDPKPEALTSTAFYYHIVQLAAGFAEVLDRPADAQGYRALADSIAGAFVAAHLRPGTGVFDTGTQAAQAFALWYGLVPPAETEAALAQLAAEIEGRHGGHVSTGIFGTKMLFDVLRAHDRDDLAYGLAAAEDYPGWNWMLAQGATTLWESWNGDTNSRSHNHPMFGSVSEWFYRGPGGLNPAPEAVGCDRWVLKPQLAGLDQAEASYTSVRGPVESRWQRTGDALRWTATLPPNTEGMLWVPAPAGGQIWEGNTLIFSEEVAAGTVPGLRYTGRDGGYVGFAAGSGRYDFRVQPAP